MKDKVRGYSFCPLFSTQVRSASPERRRDRVRKRLAEEGIETIVYYPVPVHKLPVYVSLNHGSLPLAEEAASQVLSLPIWPQMLHSAQERVAEVLGRVLR
jgi:dTDP-4-amino-4,6-dideoxygalactose transaminase